jgi:hypothetical protein
VPPPDFGVFGVLDFGVGVTAGVVAAGVGVAADRGIFGGVAPPDGAIVVGVPILAVAVPPVSGGCGVTGVAGVVAAGAGVCATVVVAGRALASCLLSAAYAAVAAPATRIASAVKITAAERHVGARELRLSGPPAPHCKHQSCPSASGAPHFAQLREGACEVAEAGALGPPGAPPAGGCCSEGATGGSASAVGTARILLSDLPAGRG